MKAQYYIQKHGLLYKVFSDYEEMEGDSYPMLDSEWTSKAKALHHCKLLNGEPVEITDKELIDTDIDIKALKLPKDCLILLTPPGHLPGYVQADIIDRFPPLIRHNVVFLPPNTDIKIIHHEDIGSIPTR